MPYQFRDDLTMADVAFEVTGRDREELFRSAWQALLDLMLENAAALKKATIKTSKLENDSLALLLIDFLNEALFYKDADGLFLTIDRLSITGERAPFTLEATLAGEPVDRSRHELGTDVKAITLHQFAFERTAAGFCATVVVDV